MDYYLWFMIEKLFDVRKYIFISSLAIGVILFIIMCFTIEPSASLGIVVLSFPILIIHILLAGVGCDTKNKYINLVIFCLILSVLYSEVFFLIEGF